MRIAIIGGGISGLVSAWLLADDHDITLFDANDYVGGHTNTVDLEIQGKPYAVDTGFIVFNETTYPGFCSASSRALSTVLTVFAPFSRSTGISFLRPSTG
jgi:predicted NAD/FAD-binding protein